MRPTHPTPTPGAHRHTPAAAAARRVSYNLTFTRTPHPRRFTPTHLDGPPIPDARRPGHDTHSQWTTDQPTHPTTTQSWITDVYLRMAVQEAIHEVCEHFLADDHRILDPHGTAAHLITACTNELADKLAIIATTQGTHNDQPIRPRPAPRHARRTTEPGRPVRGRMDLRD